jgi:hypothetical protein
MALQPSPLLRGFEQGADGEDVWNRMMPGEERGPLTLDPRGVALGQQFQAIKAGIEAQQARPIWNVNNRIGEETLQSMGMPQPTTYAGPVGQFIDPATGRMTEQGAARMQNPMLGVDTGGLGMIKAYHGSPHQFDAFSDHAIGTGEGAQAYGYGHYVAENEGVARSYRDMLGTRSMDLKDPDNMAAWMYHKNMGNRADAITELETSLQSAERYPKQYQPGDVDRFRTALDKLKSNAEMPPAPGHMYEVNVAADPEKFLHWDKPLSEQHPDVQKVLRDLGVPDKPHVTGSMAYNDIAGQQIASGIRPGDKMAEIIASQKLRDAGIPGIRYLDQGSRRAGDGTHNAVIFDPATMEIIRRYGLAGLMGGGAAALAGGGNQEQ